MKEKIIKISIIALIIILIIGIILLIVKNRNKKEYSLTISNYLKNKYGSVTEFEIKDIKSDDRESIGDGYAMGTDKTPVVISSFTSVNANVLSKKHNITFNVSFTVDKNSGKENSFYDNLEDLLVKDDMPKIVSKVTNESMEIDKNIMDVDIQEPKAKTKNYKTTPNKDEISISSSLMYVDYRVINVKDKFNNAEDVFNFAKQYFVELIKILKNNNVECDSIDIAFNDTNSSSDFYTIVLDIEKKEASVYSNITRERFNYAFDGLSN